MERPDDDSRPLARSRDLPAHPRFPPQVRLADLRRPLSQRPPDRQRGTTDGLGAAARRPDLDQAVPQLVVVADARRPIEVVGEALAGLGRRRSGIIRRSAPPLRRPRQVAGTDRDAGTRRPADRREFRGEIRERVERQVAAVLADRSQGDRRDRVRMGEPFDPRLHLHRELDQDVFRGEVVQDPGHRRRESGRMVSDADDERVAAGPEGLGGLPDHVLRRRSLGVGLRDHPSITERSSHSLRHVRFPDSARRFTTASQYPSRRPWSSGSSLRTTPRR